MSTAGTPTAFLRLCVCGLLCVFVWANEARGQDTTRSAVQDTTVADTSASEASAVQDTTVREAGTQDTTSEAATPPDTAAAATDSTAVPAPADTAAAAGPAVPSSPVLDTLSNEVFQRTLQAYLAVRDVQPAFRARYGSTGARATDDTTYRAFQRTAEQAIRSTGLAVETYRALLAAAQTDTLLRGVLRRGLSDRGDSAFAPLDSLRPDSSWIRGDSVSASDAMPADDAPSDTTATAPGGTNGTAPAPADTSITP